MAATSATTPCCASDHKTPVATAPAVPAPKATISLPTTTASVSSSSLSSMANDSRSLATVYLESQALHAQITTMECDDKQQVCVYTFTFG
jgi:hypothetical protein